MATEGTTHERMHLEEGAIVETDIEIIGIIGADGELHMKLRIDGDSNFANCIGLMEQAKAAVIAEWMASE